MPDSRELEALYRSQGYSERDARINAHVRAGQTEEAERAARGLDYEDTRVRIAQVHARDDVALLCLQTRELLSAGDVQLKLLRQIRWLLAGLLIIQILRLL